MGKFTIIGLIWLLLFAVTLILIDEQLSINKPEQAYSGTQEQEPQDNGTPQILGFVALQVNGYLMDDFWERGINDLPILTVSINYAVRNVGNVSANVVTIEIGLASIYYSTETVHNLLPNSEFTDLISFSVDYDQSKTVEIEANCNNVTAFWSYTIDAELPRHPSWGISKLFITPYGSYVRSTYTEIISSIVLIPHWMAIRDWVGRNIEYVNDYDSHGIDEFWQLGRETLESHKGDCEDLAILLCSLLRADGWSAEDVYVVVGQNEARDYHAWVKIKIPLIGWYNIEPQLDGWNTLVGDFVALHGFTVVYNFNDKYFIVL